MSKELRGYQGKSHEASIASYKKGITKQLNVMATGTGKTYTEVKLIEKYTKEYNFTKPKLWITHTDELISQSAIAFLSEYDPQIINHINDRGGFINWVQSIGQYGMFSANQRNQQLKLGAIKADCFVPEGDIVFASAQTLHRRLDRLKPDMFDMVVCDEAHLFGAPTFVKSIQHFQPKLLRGLTATPYRTDGMLLGNIFDEITFNYDIGEAIRDGNLCELDAIRVKTTLSLDNVKSQAGEFNQRELSNELNTPARNQLVAASYKKYAKERQGIVFCVDSDHAVKMKEVFLDNGISCEVVLSDEEITTDRRGTIQAYKAGKIQVLINCMILTTGFDHPNTGAIVMACPTKSLTKYLQCLDTQTEILTKNGWKGIDTIRKSDLCAGYNIVNGQIEWKKINTITKRKRHEDEKMCSVNLPGIDIRVTDGHRMIRAKRFGRKKEYLPYEFIEAGLMTEDKDNVKIPVSGIQVSKGLPLTQWELYFIGLFLSDGSINKRKNQLYIAQSAHQPWNAQIKECLQHCGIEYKLSTRTRKTQFSDSSTMNYYYLKVSEIKKYLPWLDKNLNENFEKITPYQLEQLIAGLNLGDGAKAVNPSWTRRTFSISTGNKSFADNLQSLCIRKGFRCNIGPHSTSKAFQLYIEPFKLNRKLSFSNDGRDTFKPETEWKDETVWCVSNDLETIVTRRNGKVVIMGNCVGRGSRLKDQNFVDRFGQNAIIIDIIDATQRHRLVNAWELDREKAPNDRVFTTQEKKDLLNAERQRRNTKIDVQRDQDERVDLLKLPKVKLNKSIRMSDPATEKQLEAIKKMGYDPTEKEYTKGMINEIFALQSASEKQIMALKYQGYDVSRGVTIAEANLCFKEVEERKAKKTNNSLANQLPFIDL